MELTTHIITEESDIARALESWIQYKKRVLVLLPEEFHEMLLRVVNHPAIHTGHLQGDPEKGFRVINWQLFNQMVFGLEHVKQLAIIETEAGVDIHTIQLQLNEQQQARLKPFVGLTDAQVGTLNFTGETPEQQLQAYFAVVGTLMSEMLLKVGYTEGYAALITPLIPNTPPETP